MSTTRDHSATKAPSQGVQALSPERATHQTERSNRLLQTLLDESRQDPWIHKTKTGYILEIRAAPEKASECLRITADCGQLCATIHLGPGGPRIEVHGGTLHASADTTLHLNADNIEICARTSLTMSSGGTIRQDAIGAIQSEAFEHQIESTHGEIRLIANDDVALDGERIRLNSPLVPVPPHLRPSRPSPRNQNSES